MGDQALFSNTEGSRNTASGYRALYSNSTGDLNTGIGIRALHYNTTGGFNTALGRDALYNNIDGLRNVGVGEAAGFNLSSGNDNIFISHFGYQGDSNTIRIGGTTGTGSRQQNRTFIAGIRGITTANADAVTVLIDSAGQLGTVNSSREAKQDIREIGEFSKQLLRLRPVAFRFKKHVARDPETPHEFGLIAEDVAKVFPELVTRDEEGRPFGVKYRLLSVLLLDELQRQHAELETLHETRAELQAVERRLEELEGRLPVARQRSP